MAKKINKATELTEVISASEAKKMNSRLQETPIAIIGMASVFANAKNLEEYWDNIVERIDAIIDVPASRWKIDDYYSTDKKAADKTYCKRGGFIPDLDFDPMEFGLPPNILELTDIAQLLALVVARDVMEDAGIADGSGYDRDKVGITLGVGGGLQQIVPLTSRLQGPVLEKVLSSCGVEEKDRAMIIEKFKKAYIPWEENSFPGMLGNVIAGRIANRFDLGGTNCVVDAACAGSLAAMKLAISDLLEYRSEVMISGGICCDNSPFMYMSFSKTPAFTTDESVRSFDEDSKGMMVGEGIGMIAFKRLEDAERDGDRVYAVLKGIGTSSDGRFKSIYAPRPDGQAKALKRGWDDAGFDAKTCGLIEAHGTGTMAGDAAEFGGLSRFFGVDNEQRQHIALGSVKSQIGHTKSAAGAAGFIKACLALHHKVLPATINVDKPNIQLDIENSPFYLNTETRPWMQREDGAPRRAGVSAFGFGGTNFHFVLEEYMQQQSGEYRLNCVPQTIVLAAENEHGVVAHLKAWRTKLDISVDDQPYAFNQLVTECGLKTPSSHEARLGFVAKNAIEAIATIDQALKQLESKAGSEDWSTPGGIYYRAKGIDASGKVVALFSGQGSQYVNMGAELACNFPSVMAAASAMDEEFSTNGLGQLSAITYPIPVFTDEDRDAQDKKLQLTQHAQPAIGTFSVGLYQTFQQAGFKANFTAGHSFGELTALWAAGVLSDADYRMLARARGQAMAAKDDPNFDAGTMIAVVGEPKSVAEDIKGIKGVSIANYNSNNQVVVAGETLQVLKAFDDLKGKGYKVVKLPVSAAFHTPLVGHAQKPFAAAIDKATFNKPLIPVFANGTGKAHSDKPADIKNVMKNHILESVRFNEEVDNLYAAGGRVFIEFGPKNVLTKLVENILKDKHDVVAIAINGNPKKSSDVQMRQAAVQMAVYGIELTNVDPYSMVARPVEGRKKSPMSMKLNAASYVSEKTRKSFQEALDDGYKIKQSITQVVSAAAPAAEPKVIERVVEKIVHVGGGAGGDSSQSMIESLERSVSQMVEHQKQLLDVHEKFMEGPAEYAKTFQQVVAAQAHNDKLPESVDRTLAMYHDFQTETLRVHENYLNSQTQNMSELFGSQSGAVTSAPVYARTEAPKAPSVRVEAPLPAAKNISTPAAVVTQAAQVVSSVAQSVKAAVATVAKAVTAPASAPAAPASNNNLAKINQVMMQVVAEKTGYPAEMLELGMDMEADLGIDSIKRVEILGAVQDSIPDLPELNPEDLAELRTLGQIVDYMKSKVPAGAVTAATVGSLATAAPVATSGVDLGAIQSVMMKVVAEKTGYPAEMLELGMDMEADLGIDSIKRVEILGAVQDAIPNLPELNPEDLAELRTLGQIVSYMQSKAPAGSVSAAQVASAASGVPIATGGVDLGAIQKVMMKVVAEKTGYPAEMLELGMDMEADLGIDSIKRVEILGAVQDEIPNLPELNPEDLAELRTLGQIVSYMQSKMPAGAVSAASVSAVVSASPTATGGVDLATIQKVMMKVVAEKTGYPADMLELGMDMEADLGIDSIKRVEILGAVQDEIPNLPELNPEDLAELRTLGQIVSYMQSKSGATAQAPASVAAVAVATASVSAGGASLEQIQAVMMKVVAEKTGYPADMLELGMDMEADLGIDSIKRVEILGAVQDEIPNLPELNPEDLAELRTLGQIVSYMQSKSGAMSVAVSGAVAKVGTAIAATAIAAVNSVSVTASSFAKKLMQVVAEKTGYPIEMLELDMDMEADLGIDSIKRVEILGAVQDAVPGLPEMAPETLAEMRTLGEIVTAFTNGGDAKNDAHHTPAFEPAPSATVAVHHLSSVNRIDQKVNGAHCLLVDDGSGAAIKLADSLLKNGWQVTALVPAWVTTTSKKGYAKAVKTVALDAVAEDKVKTIIDDCGQLDAVIYMHAASNISGIEYPDASKQGLMLAFLLAKLCKVKTASKARASFMVVTRQGGQLGFDQEQEADLVQGGLNGLVKTLAQEWPAVFCRAIDVNAKVGADKLAAIIEDELLDANMALNEVGYDAKGRITLVPAVTNSYELTAGDSIDADSVFLVSGGGKGVTAHCVARLAKQYHSKFILLGRSEFSANEPAWAKGITDEAALKKAAMNELVASGDKPTPVKIQQFIKPVLSNREIASAIAAIESAGGKVEYVSADVTDAKKLKSAIKPAVTKLGAITGIIHGAGVLADKFIEQKTLDDFNAVYRTKIDGLAAMLACVKADALKHLVVFSSAAGFYGNPAQSDYSIANEILNKTALRFKTLHPKAQVLSFNWGPWDGGMVTPELKKMFRERGVYIIPLDAGAELMLKELSANDNRCPQILVGNDMSGEGEVAVKKPEVSRLVKRLQAANNTFFTDHVIGENPVFPTVCAIAWMIDAVEAQYKGFIYQGLENYKLFKGIVLDGTQAEFYNIDMKLVVDKGNSLYVESKISSINDKGKPVFHYSASLLLGRMKMQQPNIAVDFTERNGKEAAAYYQNGTLFHGTSLQGFTRLLRFDHTGLLLACQVSPSAVAKQGEFPIRHSNIFANDLVYQALLVQAREQLGCGSLPSATQAWSVYREVEAGENFYLQLQVTHADKAKLVADIQLIDAEKRVIADIKSAEVTVSETLNNLFRPAAA